MFGESRLGDVSRELFRGRWSEGVGGRLLLEGCFAKRCFQAFHLEMLSVTCFSGLVIEHLLFRKLLHHWLGRNVPVDAFFDVLAVFVRILMFFSVFRDLLPVFVVL